MIVTLFGHRVFTDVLKLKSYLIRVGHIHPTSTLGCDPNAKAGPEGHLCGGNEHRFSAAVMGSHPRVKQEQDTDLHYDDYTQGTVEFFLHDAFCVDLLIFQCILWDLKWVSDSFSFCFGFDFSPIVPALPLSSSPQITLNNLILNHLTEYKVPVGGNCGSLK